MWTLQLFSPSGTLVTEYRMHYDSADTKISANSGVDQGCPLSTCGFSAAIDPVLPSVLADICRLHDPGAKLFAYLDDWHLWIKPQYLLQTFALELLAGTPFYLSSKTRSHSQSAAWVDIFKFMATSNPALLFLVEQATMEKKTQRFQRIATTLADLDAEGLNAQAVNDLLTIYSRCTWAQQDNTSYA